MGRFRCGPLTLAILGRQCRPGRPGPGLAAGDAGAPWAGGGLSTADDLFANMRDALDTLWEEGAETPKMMSVGLHMRIIGRPARARALDKFLAYARAKGGVWITRRIDIAKAWTAQHPPPG